MRTYLWVALAMAAAFSVVDAWLLASVSRDSDPESLAAGWTVFGGLWTLALGPHIWRVAPLNGLTLSLAIVLGFAAYKKYSKPPRWPDS
jgi:hypothetical protein